MESETRKLLGGVTYEIQQALAAKVAEMGGEEAMKIAFEKFDTVNIAIKVIYIYI